MKNPASAINRFHTIEELANGNSSIHYLSPLSKLITTLCFILTVASFDRYDISGLLQFTLYPLTLIILADIPFSAIRRAILLALPFTLFTALSGVFLNQAPFAVLGSLPITYGMLSGLSLLIKCMLTVSAATILMATTKLLDLCLALRALRLPNLFIIQFLLCYRYIGVLLTEAKQMSLAYTLRNPRQSGIPLQHVGIFIGQLLLKSYWRADRIYTAMQCRGFHLALQNPRLPTLNRQDWLYITFILTLLLLGRCFNFALLIEMLLAK